MDCTKGLVKSMNIFLKKKNNRDSMVANDRRKTRKTNVV